MVKINPAQLDLFVADALDIRAKHALDLMSRNLFALSKKKRTEDIYHREGDSFVRVYAKEEFGLATVFDQDILIFLISQLIHAKNMGSPIAKDITFTGYDFWRFTGKKKLGGKNYDELTASLDRLHNTHIHTDIRASGKRRTHQFTWLAEAEQYWDGNRHVGYRVILADWLYKAVDRDVPLVLTLDSRYFQLTSPIERWLYLYARKAAGSQKDGWTETLESLHKKSASLNTRSQFERSLRDIIKRNRLRDVAMYFGANPEEISPTGDVNLFEYKISSAFLGRNKALHFARNPLIPKKQHQPLLILNDPE